MQGSWLRYAVIAFGAANMAVAVASLAYLLYLGNWCSLLSYSRECSSDYRFTVFLRAAVGGGLSAALLFAYVRLRNARNGARPMMVP